MVDQGVKILKIAKKNTSAFFFGEKKDQTGGGSEYLDLNIVSVRLTFIQIPETLNRLLKYMDMLDKTMIMSFTI